MPNNTLNIVLSTNDEAVVHTRSRTRDRKVPFTMFGNGKDNRNGASMNILELMCELTDGPRKLFTAMVACRNEDNNTVRHTSLLQANVPSRAIGNHLPVLIEKDMVRRVQRGLYLINPYLVLPPEGHEARAQWIAISPDSGKNETVATPVEG
jgi:hypothetical protein